MTPQKRSQSARSPVLPGAFVVAITSLLAALFTGPTGLTEELEGTPQPNPRTQPAGRQPPLLRQDAGEQAALEQIDPEPGREPPGSGLVLADRRLIQALNGARELVEQKKYSDGLELLQKLLDSPEDRFYRPEDAQKSVLRSVKSDVRQLIGKLPAEGRDAYEVRFGGTARANLRAALESAEGESLAEVARIYFHTQAGAEAAYLLAHRYFDRGDGLAAALSFELLRSDARSRALWEPWLSLRTAIAWRHSGFSEHSKAALADLAKSLGPGARIAVRGELLPLFGQQDDPLVWLARNFGGDAADGGGSPGEEWMMAGGGPARNPLRAEGDHPAKVGWKQPVATLFDPLRSGDDPGPTEIDRFLTQHARALADAMQQADARLLLLPQPIVVNNRVLIRTLGDLRSLDAASGEIVWESWRDPVVEACLTAEQPLQPPVNARPQPVNSTGLLGTLVGRRLLTEACWGELSSSGEFVFAVEEALDVAENAAPDPPGILPRPPVIPLPQGIPGQEEKPGEGGANQDDVPERRGPPGMAAKPVPPGGIAPFPQPGMFSRGVNTLAAYYLLEDGLIGQRAWTVGGSPRDSLGSYPLAGNTFLCAPLPLGGALYCLVAERNEVRLLVLDPRRAGMVHWSQTLGSLEVNQPFPWQVRQWAGPSRWTIAYGDGILVCTAGNGSVVAIDLSSRSLLWGYDPSRQGEVQAPGPLVFPGRPPVQRTGFWSDTGFVIANHRVLFPCNVTDKLVCLNLLTGNVEWQQDRFDGMFLAGVCSGHAIVAGADEIRGWSVEKGAASWRPLKSGKPSGRGVIAGETLYLPLASGAIAAIDCADGKLVSHTQLPGARIPGNLVLAGGVLVSQGLRDVDVLPLPGAVGR